MMVPNLYPSRAGFLVASADTEPLMAALDKGVARKGELHNDVSSNETALVVAHLFC
jgi:hypothetical protein